MIYRLIFCGFTTAGAVLNLTQVITIADSFLFVCGFINLLGVAFLLPKIREEMRLYLADRKAGRLDHLGVGEESDDASVTAREQGR